MFSNHHFEKAPDRGQLALDGVWEKAHLFSRGEMQSQAEIRDYLSGRSEVAFEAFFESAFFGFRRKGETDQLAQLIARCSQALASSDSGPEFFDAIKQITNLPLGKTFLFAEIGAVNAWKSVGPFVINDPSTAYSNFTTVLERLNASSVVNNTTHPKAIEFAFDSGDGTNHWFAIPLSDKSRPFEVNTGKLYEALSLVR